MNPADFLTRWQKSGGAERANYGLFLNDLTALLGVAPPDAVTDDPARDAYVLEKPVTFDDGAGRKSTGRIDLYKRGCFVLETKQGTSTPDEQQAAERADATALGHGPTARRRKGHALRGTGTRLYLARNRDGTLSRSSITHRFLCLLPPLPHFPPTMKPRSFVF